jgi:CIC family chloride channel protein
MPLTAWILKSFRVKSSSMADEVVFAYHSPEVGIHYQSALPKLVASFATMGFGASAGMEGPSKWLGATISSLLQTWFNRATRLKWLHGKVEVLLLAGASAGIAAIFRAPLTGAIMGIESPYKQDLAHDALIHALVASAMSYATFTYFRSSGPYFPILFTYQVTFRDLAYSLVVGILSGIASRIFIAMLTQIQPLPKKSILRRSLIGGVLLSGIALASLAFLGEPISLQAGLPIAKRLLNGQYGAGEAAFIFVAKLLATAITFRFGGVGGMFLPSATIGAALGATCDVLLQPSHPGLFTLIGIAAFTGASYNSLLFAAVFVAEATGSPMLVVPSLIASSAAFLVSAGISNSRFQRLHR